MADSIEVTPSGSVGKQVFSTTEPRILKAVHLNAPTSAAAVVVRSGESSGETKLEMSVPIAEGFRSAEMECVRFDTGMHVKVTGVGAKAYLIIE